MTTRLTRTVPFIFLAGLILFLNIWLPFGQSVRIVFGSVFLFLVPGFVWTYLVWPASLPTADRLIVGTIISITGVPLLVYLLNLVGVDVTQLNVALETLGIISLGVIARLITRRRIL